MADRALSWQPESEKLSGLEYRMVGRGWWVLRCFSLANYNSRLNLLEAFYVIFRLILVVGWTHSRPEFLASFDVIKVAAVVCKIVSSFYAHIKSLWRVISCLLLNNKKVGFLRARISRCRRNIPCWCCKPLSTLCVHDQNYQ